MEWCDWSSDVCSSDLFCDFQFSRHIPGPTVCISHFSRFSVISSFFKTSRGCFSFSVIFRFLAIFQVLQCSFLIFHIFQRFRQFSSRHVDVSYFPWFTVFLPYSMSYSGHSKNFHLFQFYLPFFKSSSECFSFSMIFSFLALFKVLQWTFLNFPPF